MKTILVPTDFSQCANNAMKYALEIALQIGTSITVLYVVYPSEGVDNNMYNAFFRDDYVEQRLSRMTAWSKNFTRSPRLKEVDIRLECRIGYPVGVICEMATDPNTLLIVMGTTGAIGLLGVSLGSVAAGVLSKSKVPVFVVPPEAVFQDMARFALATDFKMKVSKKSLQIMREMLNLQHTGLNIVHVSNEEDHQPDPKQERALSERLGTIPHNFHYLHDHDIVQAVHNFLASTDCNGLVVVAHDHSLLHGLFAKSVSGALAQRTAVPMLVLHDA